MQITEFSFDIQQFACTATCKHDLRIPYGWGISKRDTHLNSLGEQMENQERMPVQEANVLLN